MAYVVRPMRLEDVEEVGKVERECFTTPWPLSAYRREIRDNRMSRYIVITTDEEPPDDGEGAVAAPEAESGGFVPLRRALESLLRPLGFGGPTEPLPSTGRIVAFAGLWLMLDESHVTTIGVAGKYRGRGLGEVLMSRLMDLSGELGASRVTLEVRVSNTPAKSLYLKYGFTEEGIRKRYYSDNNEDAAIMWSKSLEDPDYRTRLAALKRDAAIRVGELMVVPDA